MPRKSKTSSASAVAARINAQMKGDVVSFATDPRFAIERVPIGILTMERITGGGFPRGRHVELFGDEGTGKSLVVYMTMALAQQRGEVCALIDGEKVFEPEWFEYLGGSVDDLIYYRPRNADETIKVLMLFAQNNEENPGADIVGIDSVSSLVPLEELERDPEERDQPAGQARMMSRLLRRVTTVNDKTLFLWTNQVREKIGAYGNPRTTSGGRALRFYATTRIEMNMGERVKEEREHAKKGKIVTSPTVIGHWVHVRSIKEKSARPYLEEVFMYDAEMQSVDSEMEIIHLGLEDGLIERRGNVFHYTDSNGIMHSGQITKFKELLRDDSDWREELVWVIGENSKMVGQLEEETNGTG